jgi:DNA-binding PadR family transcriptional regulator
MSKACSLSRDGAGMAGAGYLRAVHRVLSYRQIAESISLVGFLRLAYSSYDIVHMNYMTDDLGIWEIAVLALLREASMHPYQMQRLLRLRHKDELLALKRGSLYHAIRRLTRSGLIQVEKTGREGKRPQRTCYRITPEGLNAFLSVLGKMVATPRRESSECMAAMSFLVHLNPKEAGQLLETRAKHLETEIAQVSSGLADAADHVARINLIESEYLLHILKAEHAWVQGLKKEIGNGTLAWDLKAILREAAVDRKATTQRRR